MNTIQKSTAEQASNEELAAIAKALAHPARIQIVRLLLSRSSCIGGEITHELALAQSTVSEHLRILKTAGIVVGEIEHPRICYSLSIQSLQSLIQFLSAIGQQYQSENLTDGLCCPLQKSAEQFGSCS
ncbi:ArsR/SmtB family transcription factor [Rheinheimera soli]|uniref:ArsR/SmtB family transcription factor n=1 Tax=Rheinheimera soli TaxID=443616 RepID=UPI001E3E2EE6|nr:metalloregulator ArsR/SmtB family transcription factor [Rheinheimera soli]